MRVPCRGSPAPGRPPTALTGCFRFLDVPGPAIRRRDLLVDLLEDQRRPDLFDLDPLDAVPVGEVGLARERLQEELSREEPVALQPSEEYAAGIIRSLTTGEPTRINASVLNHGIISNLPDGCVEVLVKGPADKVDELCAWLRMGPPMARVDDVLCQEYTGELPSWFVTA